MFCNGCGEISWRVGRRIVGPTQLAREEREFGAFLESQWIGHTQAVAREHYLNLMVTQEDLERATAREPKATQNATQHTAATGGTGSQLKVLEREEPLDLPSDTRRCDSVQHQLVGDTGFEPVTSAV